MHRFDAIIVGAGAAGLMCAGMAGQRGLRVLLIDHAAKVAEKIRISGGGRCNFTNRDATPDNFVSSNSHYCKSSLARYTPQDFLALVRRHGIAFHEKHKGQLFCDESSQLIIDMLLRECEAGGVVHWQPCAVQAIDRNQKLYELQTDRGPVAASQLIIATGGLSIPKIGASDFGYRIARQFGHRIVETRPALVPLTFGAQEWEPYSQLAGVSLPAGVETGDGKSANRFTEDLLFTHQGLSGPAILQISTYWKPGTPIRIDLAPGSDLRRTLLDAKKANRKKLLSELAEKLPRRVADSWLAQHSDIADRFLPEVRDRDIESLAVALQQWKLVPSGTLGYRKAEVTAGGVDTRSLDSQTMQSQINAGLYFIGEVVDVTGWLGGYNFQWAWASAAACARSLEPGRPTDKSA